MPKKKQNDNTAPIAFGVAGLIVIGSFMLTRVATPNEPEPEEEDLEGLDLKLEDFSINERLEILKLRLAHVKIPDYSHLSTAERLRLLSGYNIYN